MIETYKLKKLYEDGRIEDIEAVVPKEIQAKIYEKRKLVYETTATPEQLKELEDGYKYVHFFNKVFDPERYPFLYKQDDIGAFLKVMEQTIKREDSCNTYGLHCVTLCTDGKVVFAGRDIIRHNALFKAIGDAFNHNCSPAQYMVCTTSRVHYSFVDICSKANIKCIVSKGSVSDSAITHAEDSGISLYGFVGDGSVIKFA